MKKLVVLVDDLNKALNGLPTYTVDIPEGGSSVPPPAGLVTPARTAAEALSNARLGYLMDGATRSTDNPKTLAQRTANVVVWSDAPSLAGVPADSREYGILIGRIHDMSPFGVATGVPVPTQTDFVPLQQQVDDFNASHQGGPSGG